MLGSVQIKKCLAAPVYMVINDTAMILFKGKRLKIDSEILNVIKANDTKELESLLNQTLAGWTLINQTLASHLAYLNPLGMATPCLLLNSYKTQKHPKTQPQSYC